MPRLDLGISGRNLSTPDSTPCYPSLPPERLASLGPHILLGQTDVGQQMPVHAGKIPAGVDAAAPDGAQRREVGQGSEGAPKAVAKGSAGACLV